MASIGSFPGKGMIRSWLKAGVMEEGRFAPTGEGTPQGGVISPLLLNIALHGMSAAAGCLEESGQYARSGAPVLIRYADDFIVLCHSEKAAHQARQDLARWLAPRGLAFNEEKTRVVHLDEGFDFLGFNIRRYSGKLLIKPSKDAIKKVRARLRDEMHALRGSNAKAVVKKLNPVIKGWATYYRTVVSPGLTETWTTTCGSSLTSGPSTPTRRSREPGPPPGTSASSTRPAGTGGCSATEIPASTCSSSAGPRSKGTCASPGRTPATTRA